MSRLSAIRKKRFDTRWRSSRSKPFRKRVAKKSRLCLAPTLYSRELVSSAPRRSRVRRARARARGDALAVPDDRLAYAAADAANHPVGPARRGRLAPASRLVSVALRRLARRFGLLGDARKPPLDLDDERVEVLVRDVGQARELPAERPELGGVARFREERLQLRLDGFSEVLERFLGVRLRKLEEALLGALALANRLHEEKRNRK